MLDLSNKVVLLTGIGAVAEGWGNGMSMAMLFARQGATIFGCDINVDSAKKTANLIQNDAQATSHPCRKAGGSIVDVMQEPIDVTKMSACKKFVDACMAKHRRIDILINNVGGSHPGGPAEMDEDAWDAQINKNLKHVYMMCHLVLPIMEKQETGGSVVTIASIAGLRHTGKPHIAYSTAKAGVIQFTKVTAVLYAQRTGGKVRLNSVLPGQMATPLVTLLAKKYNKGDFEGFRKLRDLQVPTGKMGTGWDTAQAALWLASDEAHYVTGQEIITDGAIINSTGLTIQEFAKLDAKL